MAETREERLGRLEKDVYAIDYHAGYVDLDKDILWLIEQVRRGQKFEEDIKDYRRWLNVDIREKRLMKEELKKLRIALGNSE